MRTTVFACLALAAWSVAAQQLPEVIQTIEVHITNVDVIVTDANGKRVRGLGRDDFEVYDGGKLQPITNFSEFVTDKRTGAAQTVDAAAPPPRYVVFFIDAFSTRREDRRRAMPALFDLVRNLRPDDEAMVVGWNRFLRIYTPPTPDHAAIEKGIEVASSEMSLNGEALTMWGDRWQEPAHPPLVESVPDPDSPRDSPRNPSQGNPGRSFQRSTEMRRRAVEARIDLTESIRALKAIILRLGTLDGRRAIVLVSKTFSFTPSRQLAGDNPADLQLWLETVNAPPLLKELADTASAAGVAIYGIHAEGISSGYSAATNGVGAYSPGYTTASIDGLRYLGVRTGGLAAGYANYFTGAVAAINEDLGSYYSIGYRSPSGTVDRRRDIEVRARDHRYTVRARRAAVDRSPAAEMPDRVVAALLFPFAAANELGIEADPVSVEKKDGGVKSRVEVRIPMRNLVFRPGESNGLGAQLTILVASGSIDGSTSPVRTLHTTVPAKEEQISGTAERYYTYVLDAELRTEAKDNRLSIGVIDDTSQATAVTTVDIEMPVSPSS